MFQSSSLDRLCSLPAPARAGSACFLSRVVYPPRPVRQLVPVQAHRVGQGHGLGRWWEPAAALTCSSLFTAFDVLQKLGEAGVNQWHRNGPVRRLHLPFKRPAMGNRQEYSRYR